MVFGRGVCVVFPGEAGHRLVLQVSRDANGTLKQARFQTPCLPCRYFTSSTCLVWRAGRLPEFLVRARTMTSLCIPLRGFVRATVVAFFRLIPPLSTEMSLPLPRDYCACALAALK